MLTKQTTIVGAGALAIGSIFGHMLSGPGGAAKRELANLESARASMSQEIAELSKARTELSDQVAAFGEAQAGLTEQVSGFGEQITALQNQSTKVTESLSALEAGVETVKSETAKQLGELSAAVTSTATKAVTDVESTANESAEAAKDEGGTEAMASAVTGTVIKGAGSTAQLTEGLRVFLSRSDAETGRASAAINGVKRVALRKGQPHGVDVGGEFCHLTLTDISDAGASFAHVCGADVPAPVGVRAGQTAVFEDHGVRAFVSQVKPDQGMALLAVNGLNTAMVGYDQPLKVATENARCELSLLNIDRGHAAVDLSC